MNSTVATFSMLKITSLIIISFGFALLCGVFSVLNYNGYEGQTFSDSRVFLYTVILGLGSVLFFYWSIKVLISWIFSSGIAAQFNDGLLRFYASGFKVVSVRDIKSATPVKTAFGSSRVIVELLNGNKYKLSSHIMRESAEDIAISLNALIRKTR
jgi:hypothetical protein